MLRGYIVNELQKMGAKSSLKGYNYIVDSVLWLSDIDGFCKAEKIYTLVGEQNGTSAVCVERNIRFAVEDVFKNGNIDYLTEFFGYTVNPDRGKPTNSEFLMLLNEKIKLNNE